MMLPTHAEQTNVSSNAPKAGAGRGQVLTAIRATLTGLHYVSPALAARLAYGLFFYVRRRRPTRTEAAALQRAERHTVVHDGVAVPVYIWGPQSSRRTILAIHGWEGYAGQFGAIAEALQKEGVRTISFDAPGHGQAGGWTTTTQQMTAIARTLIAKHGPIHGVVAHSFGTMVAASVLREELGSVDRAVLLSGVYGSEILLEGFQTITGASDVIVKAMISYIEGRHKHSYYTYSGENLVPGQRVPALIIHDRQDREVPATEAERYLAAWPRSELLWTDGLGHRRILFDKSVVSRVVTALIGSQLSRESGAVNVLA